ncbi:nuclear transport factor 2 family protein [Faecalibacterium prausnitzii]
MEEHLTNMNIYDFWKAVLDQNENEIRKYFQNDAYINWHCTNERFNVDEFIIANCEYPGDWEGSVERVEMLNDLIVTVVNVYPKGRNSSFHVTSFIKTKEDKIVSMDEYWADDGNAPQWRLDKHIGKAIR